MNSTMTWVIGIIVVAAIGYGIYAYTKPSDDSMMMKKSTDTMMKSDTSGDTMMQNATDTMMKKEGDTMMKDAPSTN